MDFRFESKLLACQNKITNLLSQNIAQVFFWALLTTVGLGLLLSSTPSNAAPSPTDSKTSSGTIQTQSPSEVFSTKKKNSNIGYQYSYLDYQEPGVMRESGSLHGVKLTHLIQATSNVKVDISGAISGGVIQYEGGYQNSDETLTAPGHDVLAEADSHFGIILNPQSSMLLIPYIGLSARYLSDSVQAAGAYEREISQIHLPLGVELQSTWSDSWHTKLGLEYSRLLAGQVKSHLSQANTMYPDITNRQREGFGAKISASTHHQIGQQIISVSPSFEYLQAADSESVRVTTPKAIYTFYEPFNITRIYGMSISLAF